MDSFFGISVRADTTAGMTLALLLAVAVGALIGLERELHGHPAGLRTHILVCVGATLITLVSTRIGAAAPWKADPARLAAQIVTGIGFLGAGAIMREGATIRGLTTAASIWVTAALGIAVGAGPQFGALAVIAALIVLATLWVLQRAEQRIDVKRRMPRTLDVHIREGTQATAGLLAHLAERGVVVCGIECEEAKEAHARQMLLRVRVPPALDLPALLGDLTQLPGVRAVHMME